ncbi:MAG: DNA-3-methyladenine glycosylase family protein [Methylophilaceae bacterium]
MSINPYYQASQFLTKLDTDWAHLIETVGPCTFKTDSDEPYAALISAVAYQQLHPKAGNAILARLLNLYTKRFPSPSQILATEFDALRACGFSSRKIETIYGIAHGAQSGLVPDRNTAEAISDIALIERLIALKGIGRWSVEMLLMFTLGRMDILPADDFGICEGYKRLKKLTVAPKRKEMAELSMAWSPHRTVASWYLWRVPR